MTAGGQLIPQLDPQKLATAMQRAEALSAEALEGRHQAGGAGLEVGREDAGGEDVLLLAGDGGDELCVFLDGCVGRVVAAGGLGGAGEEG